METQTGQTIMTMLETAFSELTDHRVFSPTELTALAAFFVYGQNLYSQFGADWTGCSFSQAETSCLLVARRAYEGTPQVVFVTGRTPTDCVRIWFRKFCADELMWVRDKFR